MNRKLFLCIIQWCGEPQWFDVIVIENAVSAQSRQQTSKVLTNNTASRIECPHSPVLIYRLNSFLKVKIYNYITRIFFVVALNVCHTSSGARLF